MEGLDTNEFESLDQHIQAIYPDCEGSSLRVRNLILDTFARACRRLLRGTRFQRLNLVNSVYSVYLRARVNRIATGVGTVTVLFRQLQIEVDASDITIVPTLLDGSYERRELDRFEAVAPHLRTFVDVGCNVGIYSIAALKANPKLHVLAFDPGEASRQILARNLQRNGISDGIRFELVSKAVSNEVGSRPWIVTGFSGTSHLANPDVGGEVAQIVNMTTLDDELLPRGGCESPMFIKVDVEGWEPEVIEGAAGVISNFRPILQLEISRSPSSSERWSKILGIIEESYEEVEVFGSRRGPFTSNDVRGVIQHLSLDQKLHNIVLWPKGSDDL